MQGEKTRASPSISTCPSCHLSHLEVPRMYCSATLSLVAGPLPEAAREQHEVGCTCRLSLARRQPAVNRH